MSFTMGGNMKNKAEVDIDEVVSGYFFVEIKEQPNYGVLSTVFRAVKSLFKNNQ